MGGKRTGAGKLVYFCIACLVLLAISSCAFFKERAKEDAREEAKKEIKAGGPGEEGAVKEEDDGDDRKQGPRSRSAAGSLLRAKRALVQGDYDGSLRESQRSLSLAGRRQPGDEALYTMGLVYAHYKNPKRDYRKSIDFFGRLLKDFPLSSLAEEARIWIGVLRVIEKSKQVDIDIEEMRKELSR